MRAIIGIVLVTAAAVGCTAVGGSSGESERTRLTIGVVRGAGSPDRAWTLRCPSGGTHPDPERACAELRQLGESAFTDRTGNIGCPPVYGGPWILEIRGTHRGRPVDVDYELTPGCTIDYRDRYSFLIPRAD